MSEVLSEDKEITVSLFDKKEPEHGRLLDTMDMIKKYRIDIGRVSDE